MIGFFLERLEIGWEEEKGGGWEVSLEVVVVYEVGCGDGVF